MEPSCLVDDAEFWLPPEFLTDGDFLVEKENKESVFPYEPSHGLGEEESFLAGLSRKMVQATLEDDDAAKAWGMTRRPTQSTRCGGGFGCPTRVAAAWDLYCAAAEELAMMNLYNYNNHSGREVLELAAAKISNDGSGFYSRQSLQYQKLQPIQFQQLKQQQQLMKHRHQIAQQSGGLGVNNNAKLAGHVDLAPSAWPPQRRDGSGMRADFLGDRTVKRGSTGTGVFLPRRVDQTSPVTAETRKKHTLGTARVAHVLNQNKPVVHQTPVRSSPSFNDALWRQRSNDSGFSSQVKMEQAVNEPRLPLDWAY